MARERNEAPRWSPMVNPLRCLLTSPEEASSRSIP